MEAAQQLFRKEFGHVPPHLVTAPGRLELLGDQGNTQQGLVFSLAVNRFHSVAIGPRPDGKIELVSSAPRARHRFWLSHLDPDPSAPWADTVKDVLGGMRRRRIHFGGFNAAIHTSIPEQTGLGAEAALAVAIALAVRQVHPYSLSETGAGPPPPRDRQGRLPELTEREKVFLANLLESTIARRSQLPGGFWDYLSCLSGRADHAIQIDCLHRTVEWTPLIGDVMVVLCPSGVPPERSIGPGKALHRHCRAAARALGVKSLRSVDVDRLRAGQHLLTEREYRCAYHLSRENQRVVAGERALQEGALALFGELMLESHESSRDFFQNSTLELDLLVEFARRHPACYGARLMGGGFGGSTINLVQSNGVAHFMKVLARQFELITGRRITPLPCQVVDGAH